MTTVYDVPPTPLIAAIAAELRKQKAVEAPEWAAFVKTGIHREKPPVESDWWATRVAAVMRKVYTEGPIGTEKMRQHFGGFRDRGAKPNKAAKGSGSIARKALQQLEAAGLVQNIQSQGRVATPAGRALCDNAAHGIRGGLEKTIEGLAKY
jgi:small subunit ribosomal protein S19e